MIGRNAEVRLLRDNVRDSHGQDRFAKALQERRERSEDRLRCGISLVNYNDIKPGDVIEAFVTERVAAEAMA